MSTTAILGLAAALVALIDTIPYVRDILRGSTRPHRGTWLIWGVLATVALASQEADGARWSLPMAGAQAVVTVLILILSVRYGEGGAGRLELALTAIALGGVVGWMLADEPVVATACVVAADVIGAALMLPKTWRDPGSETLATFALASLSGVLGAGAVGALDASLLLYPAYFAIVNGAIAAVIVVRRRALATVAPEGEPELAT